MNEEMQMVNDATVDAVPAVNAAARALCSDNHWIDRAGTNHPCETCIKRASKAVAAALPMLNAELQRLQANYRMLADDFDQVCNERAVALQKITGSGIDLGTAQAAVDRVRALHRPVDVEPSETICAECSTLRGAGNSLRYFPAVEWPCETHTALHA